LRWLGRLLALALCLVGCQQPAARTLPPNREPPPPIDPAREPDVVFWPTPEPIVDKMLELAHVTDRDLVYDLGCGDGRIVIRAAQRFGAHGYGVDIDPKLVAEARESARKNGVAELVTIEQRDIYAVDVSPASVVALYLLPGMNKKLIPQLAKLDRGARIVAYQFPIPGVAPGQKFDFDEPKKTHTVYLWEAPLEVTGRD
jgi:SAM-dependent methyltransferase